VRTEYGPFTIDRSHSVEDIREAADGPGLASLLCPLDHPLQQLNRLTADDNQCLEIIHGHNIPLGETDIAHPLRVYTPSGKFLAIMKFVPETLLWHPIKVFNL
jgi:tRNA U55 pseudouridine synthase TruB